MSPTHLLRVWLNVWFKKNTKHPSSISPIKGARSKQKIVYSLTWVEIHIKEMDTSSEEHSDNVPLLQKEKNEESVTFRPPDVKDNSKNKEEKVSKKSLKRKRQRGSDEDEEEMDDIGTNPISEVFLKIMYPLSIAMDKFILIGVFKALDFAPGILLNHNGKSVLFTESGWNSFTKNKDLVQCYLLNKVYGKKTGIRLHGCNIEVENVKLRSTQGVRFRNLAKYDAKVILNAEEFSLMLAVTPAVCRYLEQLIFCGPVIKDYLLETTYEHPHMQLIYGPIDTSIYNRLPQEVNLFRSMCTLSNKENLDEEENESLVATEEEERDEQVVE